MPAYRNINVPSRRSRRLSQQESRNYAEDEWENYDVLSSGRLGESVSSDVLLSPTSITPASLIEPPSDIPSISISQSRHSHSRRQPEGHIPRPPNAFMVYRSLFWALEKQKKEPIERNHRNISRIVSHCWNSLSNEEKAQYQALAEQRKQLHRLEYPDYKYAPTNHTSKAAKKKPKKVSNKVTEEEEEKCRKLAALVMDGLSSNDIQEVMRDTKRRPKERKSKTRQPRPRSHRRASSPSLPDVSANTGGLQAELSQGNPIDPLSSEEFVPTSDIPPLDLSAPKDEQVLTPNFDTSIRPMGYDAIDFQFGCNPTISQFNPDTCFWHTADGGPVQGHLSFADDSLLSMVELKNPFEYTNWNPTFDQDREDVNMVDDIDALTAYSTDIAQYLHFDY